MTSWHRLDRAPSRRCADTVITVNRDGEAVLLQGALALVWDLLGSVSTEPDILSEVRAVDPAAGAEQVRGALLGLEDGGVLIRGRA